MILITASKAKTRTPSNKFSHLALVNLKPYLNLLKETVNELKKKNNYNHWKPDLCSSA